MVARGRMEAALLVLVMILVVGVLGRERCTTDQQRKMQVLSCVYLSADLPQKKSPESSLKKGSASTVTRVKALSSGINFRTLY